MGGGEYRGARYDPHEPPDRVAAGMRRTLKALRERGVIDPAYRTSVARRDGRFRVTLTVPNCTGAISTHALREEGDLLPLRIGIIPANFYPRPPRGGRLRCHSRGRE